MNPSLAFAGTPAFAAEILAALISAGYDIRLVLTQPDRPAGRGMKLAPSPVKTLAEAHGIPVFQPESLKNAEAQARLAETGAKALIVAAYGLILPPAVLSLFPAGCLNLHASLLPRWRGAAPIERAILAGDDQTGVCLMQMAEGLDTGPVLTRVATPIESADTATTLRARLARLAGELLVDALPRLDSLTPAPQPEGASYAAKLTKAEALIDWQQSATTIDRQIRAFEPAQSTLRGTPLKIWQATLQATETVGAPGEVVAADKRGIDVACGEGVLRLTELQLAGKKRLAAREFLAGRALAVGDVLGQD
ncbi:MAG: methionyl-tRNA formyltransferase [Zoogloeaceae bacterium]|jgi:methionyl-tRNA formyltransferase|nr:methionyl-tRNA formyltransferase [Zoogloeaceae bacterium]